MEMNEFQKKAMSLWKDNIKKGFNIEAGRQIGKSTLCLFIANKFSNKETGFIIYSAKHSTSDLLKRKSKELKLCKNHVEFVCAYSDANVSSTKLFMNKKYKTTYHIYDEIDLEHAEITRYDEPNTMKISTEIYTTTFKFGNDWYANNIKENLIKLRKRLGNERFMFEYNCNIISKTLSDKVELGSVFDRKLCSKAMDVYKEKDVKEFIKQVKHEINVHGERAFECSFEIIDKLAGERFK